MTRRDVIQRIANRTGIDSCTSKKVVDSFFEVVQASLTQGEPIYIRQFGSFILKRRAQKAARNMAQHTAMVIAPYVVPTFKPSPGFREKVRAQPVRTKPEEVAQ